MDLELKENPVVSEVEACARYGTGSMGATGIMKSAFELISLSISLVYNVFACVCPFLDFSDDSSYRSFTSMDNI